MAIIPRRKTVTALVGGVRVGSDAPIVVQSMTNTDTADIPGTVQQVAALARAGSELVRVTVNNDEAAAAVPHIVEQLDKQGIRVPIIGDFHYNGHVLLTKYPECARDLAKYRINPGNASIGKTGDSNFRTMIEVAVKYQKPVRIGVNWGSLDSVAADPHDGREFAARRAERRAGSHDGSDGRERAELGETGRAVWAAPGPDHFEREGQWSAGFDRRLPRTGGAMQLSAASWAHRSRHGREGRSRLERGDGRGAAGRHRRHDSGFADSRTGRRSHRRSSRGAADSAIAGHSQLHAAGYGVPWLRTHHQHVLPGDGRTDSDLSARADAGDGRAATSASKR